VIDIDASLVTAHSRQAGRCLHLDELLCAYLPQPDPRCKIAPAKAIGARVRNLAVCRRPLYGLSAWAAGDDPALVGLRAGEAHRLNDDRVGRALDQVFVADRASLMTALSLRAIERFGVEVGQLHNDSTSITLFGVYRHASGAPRHGVRPPVPEHGSARTTEATCCSWSRS
jgi:hypothetical protein